MSSSEYAKKIHHLKSSNMRNLCAFFAEMGSLEIDKWQNCLAVSELRKSAADRSYYFLPRMDSGGGFSFSAEFDVSVLVEKELLYAIDGCYVSYLPDSLLKRERSKVSSEVHNLKHLSTDDVALEASKLLFGETPILALEERKDMCVYCIAADRMPDERYVASVINSGIKHVLDMSETDPRMSHRSPVSVAGLMSLYGIELEYVPMSDDFDVDIDILKSFAQRHKKVVLSLDTEISVEKTSQMQQKMLASSIGFSELPLAGKH